MSLTWEADGLMALRSENVGRYKRSFLSQVVCEFRFPTLMELGAERPPASFVSALRKEYPTFERTNEVTLGLGTGSTGSNHAHVFRAPKLNWAVSLKQSSFSLETTAYTDFAHMKQRILRVVEAASKIIDSDFFTRIGIRYINAIDRGENPAEGWINPELVGPLRSGAFQGILEYAGKLQVTAPDGGALVQHGIRLKPKHLDETVQPEYVLDLDVYRNEVELRDAGTALDAIHSQAFDIFDWALGDKAREYLSSDRTLIKG